MIFGIIQKTIENDAVWSPDVGNGKIWAFEPITSIELAVEVHGGDVFTWRRRPRAFYRRFLPDGWSYEAPNTTKW